MTAFFFVSALIALAFTVAVLWADAHTPHDDDDEFVQSSHVRLLDDQEPAA